jgi:cell division transport system ATP-binding protein
MSNHMVIFNQVHKKYSGNISAIENLSFNIDKGELVFLAGPSGAGKSTILKLIAGIETASDGEIIVNGIDLSKTNQNHRTFIRQHIGFIFQDHKILFDRNVFENVRLALDILSYDGAKPEERIKKAIASVGLEHKLYAMPQELSGGEQQRLCIARAVVHKPKILIADEPTANLDRENAMRILELFKMFHKAGVTIIISAHDENILSDYGKRIIRINNGQLGS